MLLDNRVPPLRERREQVFRPCGGDLLLPAAAKVSKSAGRRGGNSNAPSPAPLPSDQRGPAGPLWIPPWSERSSVRTSRKELARLSGRRRAIPWSVGRAGGNVRTDKPSLRGNPNGGPQPPFGRCGGLGVPRGKGTHSKGSLSPLACFCLLFPRGKRRSLPQERNSPAPVIFTVLDKSAPSCIIKA